MPVEEVAVMVWVVLNCIELGAPEIVHVPDSTLSPVGKDGKNVQLAPDSAERADEPVLWP